MSIKLPKNKIYLIALWLSISLPYTLIHSQDLEPGFLSAMPIGGNFIIGSYSHSGGNILLDNTLPIEDLNANLNNFILGYARSFKLFNKLAKFDVIAPYSLGEYKALVNGENTSVIRNGFADPLFRMSMLLIGVKPLKPEAYFKHMQKRFKLGVVFRFRAPLGSYNSNQLLNIGSNRWSFKTGIAGSYTFKRIVLEGHINSWFFTTNDDYFKGNINKQKTLFGVQLHATYAFKPGIWLALSVGKTFGGETELNGIEQDITQNNSRFGAAFAYRLNKNNGLKIAYTNGFITRNGADFNTLLVAYQFMWFDKK